MVNFEQLDLNQQISVKGSCSVLTGIAFAGTLVIVVDKVFFNGKK